MAASANVWLKRSIVSLFYVTLALPWLFRREHRFLVNAICTTVAFALWLLFYLLYVKGKPAVKVAPAFDAVAFLVGVFFVLTGMWFGIKFLPGTPTLSGSLILVSMAVAMVFGGMKIIRTQWKLLNSRKASR